MAKYIVKQWGLKRLVGFGILGFELGAFGWAYWIFHNMNTSQDYRQKQYHQFPWALKNFYLITEYVHGNSKVKDDDYKKWGIVE